MPIINAQSDLTFTFFGTGFELPEFQRTIQNLELCSDNHTFRVEPVL